MRGNYRTIFQSGTGELIIKKSRFIGYSMPTKSEAEALAFIDKIRSENRSATHNCYAYRVEENGVLRQRYSDDGEPGGTAGLPMVSVLEKERLINLCVVVTRYFGGVKLGTGGLVSAYTDACKVGIEAGILVQMKSYSFMQITISYELFGKLEYYLQTHRLDAVEKEYGAEVILRLYIPVEKETQFVDSLVDLLNGKVEVGNIGTFIFPTDDTGKIMRRSEHGLSTID